MTRWSTRLPSMPDGCAGSAGSVGCTGAAAYLKTPNEAAAVAAAAAVEAAVDAAAAAAAIAAIAAAAAAAVVAAAAQEVWTVLVGGIAACCTLAPNQRLCASVLIPIIPSRGGAPLHITCVSPKALEERARCAALLLESGAGSLRADEPGLLAGLKPFADRAATAAGGGGRLAIKNENERAVAADDGNASYVADDMPELLAADEPNRAGLASRPARPVR